MATPQSPHAWELSKSALSLQYPGRFRGDLMSLEKWPFLVSKSWGIFRLNNK